LEYDGAVTHLINLRRPFYDFAGSHPITSYCRIIAAQAAVYTVPLTVVAELDYRAQVYRIAYATAAGFNGDRKQRLLVIELGA
jgi:hypothetical protein